MSPLALKTLTNDINVLFFAALSDSLYTIAMFDVSHTSSACYSDVSDIQINMEQF
jgi:hypothetical protein